MKEELTIKKIMQNEFAQIVFFGSIFWGIITTVVLPLQRLQIQVAQVQLDLSAQNKKYDILNNSVNSLGNRMSVTESELNSIFKK